MVDAAIPGQTQFMQLYVNADRSRTKKIIAHAADRGVKALFITVDAPQLGRREKVGLDIMCLRLITGHENEVRGERFESADSGKRQL